MESDCDREHNAGVTMLITVERREDVDFMGWLGASLAFTLHVETLPSSAVFYRQGGKLFSSGIPADAQKRNQRSCVNENLTWKLFEKLMKLSVEALNFFF